MRTMSFAHAGALLAVAVGVANAEPIHVGGIVVEQAWARATTPSAKTGGAYLTVRNTGAQPDRIVSMAAPVAGHAMAHETLQEGDISRMGEAGPLDVPPVGALEMKPGGMHIMLMDLKGGLKLGQEFPLTVTFERAGRVEVPVRVGRPGAMGPE